MNQIYEILVAFEFNFLVKILQKYIIVYKERINKITHNQFCLVNF